MAMEIEGGEGPVERKMEDSSGEDKGSNFGVASPPLFLGTQGARLASPEKNSTLGMQLRIFKLTRILKHK